MVEDDREIAEMYRLGLEAAGWRVEIAPSGDSGLQSARQAPPAVVLLDVMLPGMSGIEVLRRLRGDAETSDCPVVVLSNSAGLPVQVEEAAGLGVVDWMVKSKTTPRELAARLASFR